MTANLLTVHSSKTELLLIGLSKQLAKMKNDWMLAAAALDRMCAVLFVVVFVGYVYRDGYCDMQPWEWAAPYCSA